jgi:hypothetical protein
VERDKEEQGSAHQDGKRPRKGPLFGGARLSIEPGSEFPIVVNPTIIFDAVKWQCRDRSLIEELRATLSQTNYRILHDRWIGGKSFAEIGQTRGSNAKQARKGHARKVDKLRELLVTPTRNPAEFTPPRPLRRSLRLVGISL